MFTCVDSTSVFTWKDTVQCCCMEVCRKTQYNAIVWKCVETQYNAVVWKCIKREQLYCMKVYKILYNGVLWKCVWILTMLCINDQEFSEKK